MASVRGLELRVSQLSEALQSKDEQLASLREEIQGQRKELERVHEDKKTLTLDVERKTQLLLVQRGQLSSTSHKLKKIEKQYEREPPDQAETRSGVEKQLELMNKKIGNMHKMTEREKEISKLQLMRRVEENAILISELNNTRQLLLEKDSLISALKLQLHQLASPVPVPVAAAARVARPAESKKPSSPVSLTRDRRRLQEAQLQLEAAQDQIAALTMENVVLKDQVSKLLLHLNNDRK